MKVCSHCKLSFPLDSFNKSKSKKDGLHNYCKTCHRKLSSAWMKLNPDQAKERAKKWYNDNPKNKELAQERARIWYHQNKDKAKAQSKQWRQENPEQRRKSSTSYETRRRKTDPVYKLIHNLRARLRMALLKKSKTGSAVRDLGLPIDALLVYLNLDALDKYGIPYTGNEKLFHIDHIRPLASFDPEDPEQLKRAVHWTNLQILRASENLAKGARTP